MLALGESMATTRENFQSWYATVLRKLIPDTNAGFPIALVAFPLLERYVRQKIGLPGHSPIDDALC
jgi:hypothetical protein